MKKFLSLLLAMGLVLSVLAGCCVAEATSAIDLTDLNVSFADGAAYAFPMSVADAEAAGLNVPSDVCSLEKGYYYAGVNVSDIEEDEEEGNEFSVRVVYNVDSPETPWISGVTLRSDTNAGASVCGIVMGETTQSDIVAALGADKYGNTSGDELTYYLYNLNITANCYFDGDMLRMVSVTDGFVENFGTEYTATEPDADLPAASEMELNQVIVNGKLYTGEATLQDYLDNGWKLETRYGLDDEIQARRNNTVYGHYVQLYNGEYLMQAQAYNLTEEAAALAECNVTGIVVDVEWGESCIEVANGLNIGSTYDEMVAALGEPTSTSDTGDGVVAYYYSRAIMDTYTWILKIDQETNLVVSMEVGL